MKKLLVTVMAWAAWSSAFAASVPSPLVTHNENDEHEVLLGDSLGKTLYVFDVDQGSGTSKCTGDCAEVWPPYLISKEESSGLAAPLGSVERPNRKLQLTYEGRPVYTYIYDRKVGDELGDGLGGVWHYIEIEESAHKR